jgi:CubicO group peptidase (beta-lactamase class C family)
MSAFPVLMMIALQAATAPAVGATAQPAPAWQERVDAFVAGQMRTQKVPGIALAIVKDGVVMTRGYGESNVEHHVPVTPATIFQSGSVGKQFTATAVMLLVEEGRISLEDSITRYLPDAPAAWQPIRIRHLLTHTSGIPDYAVDSFDYRRDATEDELAKMAYGLTLEFPPGAKWKYSNTGYLLLGVVIHKVSGQFYGDLLAERVFRPLGMSTARVISEADIVPNRAAGYELVDGQLSNQEWVAPSLNTTADGALYLSVQDMVAWDRGLRAGAILKPDSRKQVYTPVRLTTGETHPYGFGWSVGSVAGAPRYSHGGSWQGFRSYIARYLGADLTIILFANLAETDTEALVDGVATIIDPRLTPPPAEKTAGQQ